MEIVNKNKIMSNSIKLPLNRRPIKTSIMYLVAIIIISFACGYGLYNFLYKSNIAFLAIPVVFIMGIAIKSTEILNIIDFVCNSYVVTSAICTGVEYKGDKESESNYSVVYFKDYKNNKEFKYEFNYKARFTKGTLYKITHGKFSKMYVSKL